MVNGKECTGLSEPVLFACYTLTVFSFIIELLDGIKQKSLPLSFSEFCLFL